jgi:hypothetical protein
MAADQLTKNPPDGTVYGQSASDKISFYGATPVVQPASPSGNTHTVAAGSVTNVFVNTTFDGSIGSTAYTIGDIVVALKNLGLLAK